MTTEIRYNFDSKKSASIVTKGEANRCLLLVEDNIINQQVAQAMLKSLGFSVDIANNGEEAVEKFSPGKYSVILMDCQMPILNGFEAASKIRTMEEDTGVHTPIIALTASAFRETKERCFESGMDNFITKPFKLLDLKNVLDIHEDSEDE
ncbi:MAG: response regulator [Bdellovibrionales bacterium]|nr:response regulator [Bdellovibrionales bacterium]